MGTTSADRSGASTRVGIVIEVTLDKGETPEWVGIVMSIPGREGTSRKVWNLVNGHFHPRDWDDFEAFAFGAISSWMAGTIGIQGVLDLDG